MASSPNRTRRSIRYEAARIMADEGVRDYRKAKQKACMRLGVSRHHSVPTNLEVEDALVEQLAIFDSHSTRIRQRHYLETALAAMDWLSIYKPKLTGAALSGVITESRPVELHIFPSTVEEICALLDEKGYPYRQIEKRKRFAGRRFMNIQGFELTLADVEVEIFCYLPGMCYPPLNSATRKPVRGVSRKKVKRLLDK